MIGNEEVTGNVQPEASTDVTPGVEQPSETVVAATTPQPIVPPVDAPKQPTQQDIDSLKSVLQRQQGEQRKYFLSQLETMQAEVAKRDEELYRVKTAGMEPDEKRQFDMQLALQAERAQRQQLEGRLANVEGDQRAAENRAQAIAYYSETFRIPPERLEQFAGTPEQLEQFAQGYVKLLQQRAYAPPPTAPKVTSTRPGSQSGGVLAKIDKLMEEGNYAEAEKIFERGRISGYQQGDL
jgi:hypothetical protein